MADNTDSSSPEYTFGKSENQQIWQKTFGYHLHPDIVVPQGAAIADVGCGTGVWHLELSQSLASKNVTLRGFDIDLSQIPGDGAGFPSNVTLEQLDIMTPLPAHLESKFDIVNLQFFGFILGAGGPRFELVLRNLIKMLKPGGWLQWSEYDRTNTRFLKSTSSSSTTAMEESFGGDINDVRAKAGDWTPRLPEHFAANGLVDAKIDGKWTPPHLLGMMQYNFLAAHDELVKGLPDGNAYKAKLQKNQNGLVRDAKSGGATDILMVTAVGRKPF